MRAAFHQNLRTTSEQIDEVREELERVGALHRELFEHLLDGSWHHGTQAAVDITLLFPEQPSRSATGYRTGYRAVDAGITAPTVR